MPYSSDGTSVAVVIPCYGVRDQILEVLAAIPEWVGAIYVVDDACPQNSGELIRQTVSDPRVHVLAHDSNKGVGGAMCTGYRAAMAAGHDILVKIDGDGQMDSAYLARLVNPIVTGAADFTKGNRFYDLEALRTMPLARRLGNLGLTLLTKIASGHWHVSDPTNGYTAIHRAALGLITFDRLSPRYFFETSMLIQLNIVGAVTMDVPIPARYGDEGSSLGILRSLLSFPPRLTAGLLQRLVWRYFIYDINVVTILLFFGTLSTAGGIAFGTYRWVVAHLEQTLQSAGTVAVALLPIIIGFQMLLLAVLLDVVDKPQVPLSHLLHDEWLGTDRQPPRSGGR